MSAEQTRFTIDSWESWLNDTHQSIVELCPDTDATKLANFLVEVSDLIDQGLYPMSREGFSMFMRDLYIKKALTSE